MAALYLAGVAVDWNEFHRPFESRLRLLDLPTYAFNDKNHWLQYEGDWCLTKGNSYYNNKGKTAGVAKAPLIQAVSDLQTSTVQAIVAEEISGAAGTVTMCSDLMQADFLAAAHGYRMNDCGVVTSSIHADIAYTLGSYLFRKFYPKATNVPMNVTDLVVTKGLVAQSKARTPQLISVTAHTANIHSNIVDLAWFALDDHSADPPESFATAKLVFGDATQWLSSWTPMAHLVQGRIDALEALAATGEANRFSRNMAYTIFADRLVDYADKYRGMQSVIMHGLEGFADVQLTTKESGVWTVPPYFIDSVAHLAGFIMNCSDAMDTQSKFCVTPGWDSMRFAKPLVPGAKYRSYVKMLPTAEDPSIFLGDVYIMQNNAIIGMVGGIKFRQYPRVLIGRFFSPPDLGSSASKEVKIAQSAVTTVAKPIQNPAKPQVSSRPQSLPVNLPTATPGPPKLAKQAEVNIESAPPSESSAPAMREITVKALEIIANEGALKISDLDDDAAFADLGIDSLMSLVLAEKFKAQLNVKVNGSLFLDYPTIGDLRKWLEECY
ncbi:Non-reducing polyketide synthase PKS8-1 [Elasticomyces elasticus]|nr:Non-reducing polyketide synthase PKS8-1 [Elasticomyces elasticus]